MDNEQAKLLLAAYRPGGQDAADPGMRAALEQAALDPGLQAWFQREQQIDAALVRHLQNCPVPGDLKASILAGRKVAHARLAWHAPLLAAAALLLVGLGVFLFRGTTPSADFTRFRTEMAALVASGAYPDWEFESSHNQHISQWLQNQGAPVPGALPAGMGGLEGMGCVLLQWRGRTVSMICYNAPNGQIYHIMVVRRGDLKQCPGVEIRELALVSGLETMAWSDAAHAYLLIGHSPEARVGSLL